MTYGNPTLLIVAIGSSKKDRSIKDLDCFFEIDAMLDDVRLAFAFVPIEFMKGFMVVIL